MEKKKCIRCKKEYTLDHFINFKGNQSSTCCFCRKKRANREKEKRMEGKINAESPKKVFTIKNGFAHMNMDLINMKDHKDKFMLVEQLLKKGKK